MNEYKLLILDTRGMLGKTYNISIPHADFIIEHLNEDWFGDENITKWVDDDFNNGKPLMYPRNADFKFFLYTQV